MDFCAAHGLAAPKDCVEMRFSTENLCQQQEQVRLHAVIAVQPEGAVRVQQVAQEDQPIGQELEIGARLPDVVVCGQFAQCGLPFAAQTNAAGVGTVRVVRRIHINQADAAAIAVGQQPGNRIEVISKEQETASACA